MMIANRKHLTLVLTTALLFSSFACAQDVAQGGGQDEVAPSTADQHVIVAVGASGTPEYGERFAAWAEEWRAAAAKADLTMIGLDPVAEEDSKDEVSDKQRLQEQLGKLADVPQTDEVWIILIGHGTFDGKRAKFNLRGKDLEATELADWLSPLKQNVAVINCTSSSSPFINAISGKNRIVVSSTRSGFEYNYSRFGRFMSTAIDDLANDLDKDGQTSVLEAFCSASQSVSALYEQDGRLATEHALIDDNGDGLGTAADWFEGIRAVKKPKSGVADGLAANSMCLVRQGAEAKLTGEQRARRFELENQLELRRNRKSKMDEATYLSLIEPILIELAQLYEAADSSPDNRAG